MFQRFRDGSGTARKAAKPSETARAPFRDDDLPFDLALTRRVNGERMAPKWGTRDPAEAPLTHSAFVI